MRFVPNLQFIRKVTLRMRFILNLLFLNMQLVHMFSILNIQGIVGVIFHMLRILHLLDKGGDPHLGIQIMKVQRSEEVGMK